MAKKSSSKKPSKTKTSAKQISSRPIEDLINDLKVKQSDKAMEAFVKGLSEDPLTKNTIWLLENGLTPETELYRIFPFKWLKVVFEKSQLALSRPRQWDDPFENFFLANNIQQASGEIVSLESIAKEWYGQCWTLTKETDALWRIYSADKQGVRVTTTVRKLFASLYNGKEQFAPLTTYMSRVRYLERSEIENFIAQASFWDVAFGGQAIQFAALLSIKRSEFAHENEVRILKMVKNRNEDHFFLDIKPNSLFETITFDPRIEECELHCMKHKLKEAGCKVPFEDSKLYKIDRRTIRL